MERCGRLKICAKLLGPGGDLHILGNRYLGMLGADGTQLQVFDIQNSGHGLTTLEKCIGDITSLYFFCLFPPVRLDTAFAVENLRAGISIFNGLNWNVKGVFGVVNVPEN